MAVVLGLGFGVMLMFWGDLTPFFPPDRPAHRRGAGAGGRRAAAAGGGRGRGRAGAGRSHPPAPGLSRGPPRLRPRPAGDAHRPPGPPPRPPEGGGGAAGAAGQRQLRRWGGAVLGRGSWVGGDRVASSSSWFWGCHIFGVFLMFLGVGTRVRGLTRVWDFGRNVAFGGGVALFAERGMVWVLGGSQVLGQGFGPPDVPPTGYTPLHVAVLRRDPELVQLLLRAGADPDRPEPSCGRSPLHLAVEAQSPEVAECLLRGGARPDPRTFSGFTPLYSARRRPDPRLPPLLRRFGARDPPSSDSSDSGDSGGDSEGGAEDSEVSAGPLPPRAERGAPATVPRASRPPQTLPRPPRLPPKSLSPTRTSTTTSSSTAGAARPEGPPEPPRMDSGVPQSPPAGGNPRRGAPTPKIPGEPQGLWGVGGNKAEAAKDMAVTMGGHRGTPV
uniref:NF-kappa-B inhibitor alpha n=1 Tax=Geospiza parvula TaxID=87175 RepID=A0A8U8B0R4_GEOPR